MPFYIVCDVSGSMYGEMPALNDALNDLHSDIMSDPILDDLTMLSIITFGSDARTVVSLAPPSQITLPKLTSGGGTNYGAAFREYDRAFASDRARLKAAGNKVFRPCVFFLSDGEPGDPDYRQVFRSLFAYDPETKQGNKAYPYFVTFGFRDAKVETMKQLAYPDFGKSKGKWFFSRSNQVGDLLKSMVEAIRNTVISSGASASQGKPQIMAPVAPTADMDSGDADETQGFVD